MDSQQKTVVNSFLNKCGVECDSLDNLDGIWVDDLWLDFHVFVFGAASFPANFGLPNVKGIYLYRIICCKY